MNLREWLIEYKALTGGAWAKNATRADIYELGTRFLQEIQNIENLIITKQQYTKRTDD